MDDNILPSGCRLISIPSVTDQRGTLAFATARRDIPFPIERVFWIYGVPQGQCRGGHAHRVCAEVVFAVCGAVTMLLDDGRQRSSLRLSDPSVGLLVAPGVWCELTDFAPGTVLAVAASHPYDAGGYIHNYDQYKEEVLK